MLRLLLIQSRFIFREKGCRGSNLPEHVITGMRKKSRSVDSFHTRLMRAGTVLIFISLFCKAWTWKSRDFGFLVRKFDEVLCQPFMAQYCSIFKLHISCSSWCNFSYHSWPRSEWFDFFVRGQLWSVLLSIRTVVSALISQRKLFRENVCVSQNGKRYAPVNSKVNQIFVRTFGHRSCWRVECRKFWDFQSDS